MPNLRTSTASSRLVRFNDYSVQAADQGPRNSRTGFFSDTSDGTVADRDTTDADTDWTDCEGLQHTSGLNTTPSVRRPDAIPSAAASRASIVGSRPGAKRSSRNGRLSPSTGVGAGAEVTSNKRRKDADSSCSAAENLSGPRFACPYFKRDPQRYKTHRTCPGPGWLTVHRVKEHLYRRHSQPGGTADGISATQKDILKKRCLPSQTEDDKWRDMYRILFSEEGDTVPSPYLDDPSPAPEQHSATPFKQELLRRIRRELLSSAGTKTVTLVEERLMRQVAAIVQKCETEMLRDQYEPGNPARSITTFRSPAFLHDESFSSSGYDSPAVLRSRPWGATTDEESDSPSTDGACVNPNVWLRSGARATATSHGLIAVAGAISTITARDEQQSNVEPEDTVPNIDWSQYIDFDDWNMPEGGMAALDIVCETLTEPQSEQPSDTSRLEEVSAHLPLAPSR